MLLLEFLGDVVDLLSKLLRLYHSDMRGVGEYPSEEEGFGGAGELEGESAVWVFGDGLSGEPLAFAEYGGFFGIGAENDVANFAIVEGVAFVAC